MKNTEKRKEKKWLVPAVLCVLVVVAFFVFFSPVKTNELPVLGEQGHRTGNFSFINQNGQTFTQNDVAGKVRVVEFFFANCPAICPKMNRNLEAVYAAFKNQNEVVILSHTVDPRRDSAAALKQYADKLGVTDGRWQFLTGDKAALYKSARQDYLMAADTMATEPIDDEFIHTQYVALVDKQNQLRGFYDATDPAAIQKLIRDIRLVL